METIKDLFNIVYTNKNLTKDINIAKNNNVEMLTDLLEVLPYAQMDNFTNLLECIAKEIGIKTFCLGFSLGTKLTSESFIKTENLDDNQLK